MDKKTEKSTQHRSSANLPMKFNIVKIRKEMSDFQLDINDKSSLNSEELPEPGTIPNFNNTPINRNSQTAPEILLLQTKNEQNMIKMSDSVRKLEEKDNAKNKQNKVKMLEPVKKVEEHDFISNMLLPIVKRSVKKLRNNTIYRKMDDLKDYHLNIINDKATILNSMLLANAFFVKLKLFKPFQPAVMMIKIISFINLLSIFLYIPLETGFFMNFPQSVMNGINCISFVLLLVETSCRLNSEFFSNGVLIKSRKLVLINYCRQYLLVDLIGFFALFSEFYLRQQEYNSHLLYRLIKFLIFSKGTQFRNLYSDLVQYFKLDVFLKGSHQLLELLFFSLFIAHIIACLWYFFGILSINLSYDMNWISQVNIMDSSWQTQYLNSFYWAVVVMMTVGFGDIAPRNTLERSYCIVAIFMGCALYAYNLNKIGIILQKIYQEENEFNEEQRIINNFMGRKKIDSELQSRIKEYLRFIWNEKKTEHNTKEMEIINTLSNSLREELLLESYGGILKAFPIFYKMFSEKSLKTMVSYIKELRFVPGDNIVYEKELDDCCFYYIMRGNVNISVQGNKTVLEDRKEGQVFGFQSFFTGLPRNFTAQTTEFVSLLAIKREDFIKIIEKNPSDYQEYCMIKDSMTFQSDSPHFEKMLKCKSCGTNVHFTLHCPYIQYIPDREKIIKRYEFSHLQERNYFKRLGKRGKNSRKFQKDNIKIICKIQKNLKQLNTICQFSQLRAIFNNNDLPDSNLFESNRSIPLNENDNIHSSGSISSSSEMVDENMKSITEENQSQEGIKDNIKIIYEKIMNEEVRRNIEQLSEEMKDSKELKKEFIEIDKSFIKERSSFSEPLRNEMLKNDLKPPMIIADIDYKPFASKQNYRSHTEKRNTTTTNNNTSITPLTPTKKSTNSSKPPVDELANFEKGENFEKYFPEYNINNVLSLYDKKRKKLAYLKKFNPSKESFFYKNPKTNSTLLKDFGKYSFYPHNTLAKQMEKKNKSVVLESIEKKNFIRSPFFKRREFQKKTISFQQLVQDLISNKGLKKK